MLQQMRAKEMGEVLGKVLKIVFALEMPSTKRGYLPTHFFLCLASPLLRNPNHHPTCSIQLIRWVDSYYWTLDSQSRILPSLRPGKFIAAKQAL